MEIIERFVVLMYDRTSPSGSANECRLRIYIKKQRTVQVIPPTQNSLAQHIKREMLQT